MQMTFATWPSALARWQTRRVIQLLQAAHPGIECREYILPMTEDHEIRTPIPETGSKGIFPHELEKAILTGKADAAVHSLKDLSFKGTPGLVVAAIPEREAAFDVLVSAQGWLLSSLPGEARIGTSSLRRSAQLLVRRPDLKIAPLHGDVNARLEKVLRGEFDAIVLAQAGLIRLGYREYISEVLSLEVMLPAPGQGALVVLSRSEDVRTQELLASIHEPITAAAVYAERTFAFHIGSGCSLPVAAYAEKTNGTIILTGAVISPDGTQAIRLTAVDRDPHTLGRRLAELVLERGAAVIL